MGLLLALRFGAELGMLVALGWSGWSLAGEPLAVSVVLAAALPLAAAAAWGRWVAPKAAHRLPDPGRLAVEVALFSATAFLALAASPAPAGAAFAGAVWLLFLVSLPARRVELAG